MLSIIKNTDNSIKITFTEDGIPLSLTGYTILFTVKKQCDLKSDDDENALITKEIVGTVSHETILTLTNEDTNIPAGEYYWDLRLIKDGIITQTKRDKLEILEGITKRKLEE